MGKGGVDQMANKVVLRETVAYYVDVLEEPEGVIQGYSFITA